MSTPTAGQRPVNIVNHKLCSRLHCFDVELPGAQGLRLQFHNARLPDGHCVELVDEQLEWVKHLTFKPDEQREIIAPGCAVSIRVILPSADDSSSSDFYLRCAEEYRIDPEPLGLVGKDERQPFMCYEGSDVARYSLASALMQVGATGSGSLIGSGNFVLTNWHVVRTQEALLGARGEIWLNWVNEACDKASPVKTPLMLEADQLLATGGGTGSSDYTLFSLKEFDYTHSQVKRLFGGLRIRETNPLLKEKVYVPQYGNRGLMPMQVSVLYETKNGGVVPAEVVGPIDPNWTKCNADTQGGSSGSPIISGCTGELVGLHGAALAGNSNGGPSPERLHSRFGDIIAGFNEAVIGLGNVTVHNLDLSNVLSATFAIDLGQQGTIKPFDTVQFEHLDDRTVAQVRGLDLLSQSQFDTRIILQAFTAQGPTHLADPALKGIVNIVATLEDLSSKRPPSRSWIALGVYKGEQYVSSSVVRLTYLQFDPFEIPFSMVNARVLHVQLDEGRPATLRVDGARYGFIAHYLGTGPGQLQNSTEGYSLLRVAVRGDDGIMKVAILRGYRLLEGLRVPMNVVRGGEGNDPVSTLSIEYLPSDNAGADLPESFMGILPLRAMDRGETGGIDVLVRVCKGWLAPTDILVPARGGATGKFPRVSGRGAPGALVGVVKSNNPGAKLGSAVADGEGAWSLRIEKELPIGKYSIAARQSTSLGGSAWSSNIAFNVVEQLPEPTIDSHEPGQQSRAMVFWGTALPGSVVHLVRAGDDVTLLEVCTDLEGRWHAYLAQKPDEGLLALQVFQSLDGQVSAKSSPLEVEVIAGIESPVIDEPAADAVVSSTPVFRGRAMAGGAVTVVRSNMPGAVLARVTADENGNWEVPSSKVLPQGPYAISVKIPESSWGGRRGFGVLDEPAGDAASEEAS